MLRRAIARLTSPGVSTIELALTMLLWQASTGVFLIALVQQYLPQELDANAAFPGYALAIYAGARFLLQTPAGWFADHIGRRRTLTFGIAVAISSVFLMFQVQDPTAFLVFSALYGAGSAAVWPAVIACIGDRHAASERGRVLNAVNVSQLVGLGLGVMAGVSLLDMISYQAAFAACLVFSSLALVLAYRGSAGEADPTTAASEAVKQDGIVRQLMSLRIGLLAGIALLLSIGTTIQAPVVAQYSTDVLETKMHVLALMLVAPAAVAAIMVVRFGHVADRFGRQLPLIVGLGMAALCYFLLSQTSNPMLAANLVVLAGLGYAISIPAWGAAALDATEVGGRGLLMGVLASVQGFGGVIGQAMGGVSNAAWGPLAPFKIGALLLVGALILTVLHLQHQRRGEAAATRLA